MEDEKKAVTDASAADAGVDTKVSEAPETDPVAELEEVKKQLAKAREEKENYKKGMLLAKGKLKHQEPEEGEEPDLTTLVNKIVEERLSETSEAKATAAYEALTQKQAQELKELKLALKSKNASSSIAGGSGSGPGTVSKSETSVSYFSPEQIAELRQRGKSDAQIAKIAELAQNGPTSAIQHKEKASIM